MSITKLIIVSVIFVFFYSCKSSIIRNVEARDDAKEYKKAILQQQNIKNNVKASAETTPVDANITDDAADDPAIWVNTKFPLKSVIFGSNKINGIHSYSLDGKEIQYIKYAKINNIDVRQNVLINNKKQDILAASNRTNKSVDLFLINNDGRINNKPDFTINLGGFKPYGFCLYKTKEYQLFAFVNSKKGEVLQIEINITNNKLNASIVRRLKLSSQIEGMVVDDKNDKLYVGEEEVGIHIYSAKKNGGENTKMIKNSGKNNSNIRFDIEGLALLEPHYLVASSQGNFSYAIFNILKNEYVTSFKIVKNKIDGVEETDGIEIYSGNLGNKYPNGILIAQDGFNYDNNAQKAQNFKLVDLRIINRLIGK